MFTGRYTQPLQKHNDQPGRNLICWLQNPHFFALKKRMSCTIWQYNIAMERHFEICPEKFTETCRLLGFIQSKMSERENMITYKSGMKSYSVQV